MFFHGFGWPPTTLFIPSDAVLSNCRLYLKLILERWQVPTFKCCVFCLESHRTNSVSPSPVNENTLKVSQSPRPFVPLFDGFTSSMNRNVISVICQKSLFMRLHKTTCARINFWETGGLFLLTRAPALLISWWDSLMHSGVIKVNWVMLSFTDGYFKRMC